MKTEEEFYIALKADKELCKLALVLVEQGGGTMLSETLKHLHIEKERLLAVELSEALALERPGAWGYETAKMVEAGDTVKMREIAKDIRKQLRRPFPLLSEKKLEYFREEAKRRKVPDPSTAQIQAWHRERYGREISSQQAGNYRRNIFNPEIQK